MSGLMIQPKKSLGNTLATISRAKTALAKAKTLDDVLEIRDKAEAIRVYVKASAESLEAQNAAAEIKIRAERKAGELLAKMEKAAGGGDVTKPRLADLGINKMQSSRWQKEAKVSDDDFEQHVAECNESGKELTQASVLKLAGAGHVSQSTGENEWYTPPGIIEAARECMGGIDLDPASSDKAQETVRASTHYTIADDGLGKHWFGNVWMAPPYSKDLIGRFTEKLSHHWREGEIAQAVVLVNNATETAWFQSIGNCASCICFPSGRIKFEGASGNSNSPLQGQAIVYLGERKRAFRESFGGMGIVLEVGA